MKHAKKLLALALVFAMALALAIPAFAEEATPPSVTVDLGGYSIDVLLNASAPDNLNTENAIKEHEFVAYQIFDAAYANDDSASGELVAIKWGDGVDVDKLWTTLDTNANSPLRGKLSAITTNPKETGNNVLINPAAYGLAKLLVDTTLTADELKTIANLIDQCTTGTGIGVGEALPAGYYLVVDIEDISGEAVRNPAILEMSTDRVFEPRVKADVPQLDKTVLQQNDSDAGQPVNWGKVADYDIGDHVPFLLTSTLPSNYADYETYSYVIKDRLSDGLTYDAGTMQVFVDGVPLNKKTSDEENGYALTVNGGEITVDFGDLKATAPAAAYGSVIRVVYTATLGTNAVIGTPGNKNSAHLEFSNNPNVTGVGTEEPGKTPDDVVTVFTFELNVNKVDEAGEALSGAGFTLYKKYDVGQVPAGAVPFEEGSNYYKVRNEITGVTTFEFEGLDAGDYMLSETTVPGGYNKAEDIYFTITAVLNDEGTITKLEIAKVTDAGGVNEILNADGTKSFVFDRITNPQDDENDGTLVTSILNLKGLQLPSTGGIGTTIFYVVGGLLLVGAAVVLITKKRMGNAE